MEDDKEEEEDDKIGLKMDKIIQTREMAATAGPETTCRRILRAAGADAAEEKVGGGGAEECVLVDPEVEGGEGTHLIYQREPVLSSTMGAANTATIANMSTSRTHMDTERGIREEEKDYRTRIRWEFLDCKVNCRECKDSAPVLFIIFFATLK